MPGVDGRVDAAEGAVPADEAPAAEATADEGTADEATAEPDILLPVSLHRRSKPLQLYLQQAKGGPGTRYLIGVAFSQASNYEKIVEALQTLCNDGEISKRSHLVATKDNLITGSNDPAEHV